MNTQQTGNCQESTARRPRIRVAPTKYAVLILALALVVVSGPIGCLPPVVGAVVALIDALDSGKSNGNSRPTVIIGTIARSTTGTVSIPITTIDADGDTVTLSVEYDSGAGFVPATGTLIGTTVNATSDGVASTLEWTATPDIGAGYRASLRVRITPSDSVGAGNSAVSAEFAYGNDAPALISLTVDTDATGTVSGITILRLTISDSAGDTVAISDMKITFVGDFSDDLPIDASAFPLGGTSAITTSVAGQLTLLAWDSFETAPVDAFGVKIGMMVTDLAGANSSFVESNTFDLDNAQAPPVITLTSFPAANDTVSGNVEIGFVISDADEDPAFIVVEISTDGGNSWFPAASAGSPTFNLATSHNGTDHTFIWNSQQLGTDVVPSVLLQITVGDTLIGNTAVTPTFSVDNSNLFVAAPILTFSALGSSTGGRLPGADDQYVTFQFVLLDANTSDTVDVTVEFSADNGANFFPCTPHSTSAEMANLAAGAGTTHEFRWEPFRDADAAGTKGLFLVDVDSDGDGTDDLVLIQYISKVLIRLSPQNSPPVNTPGTPVTLEIALGNSPPSVVVEPILGAQSRQVVVQFALIDESSDLLNLTVEFEGSAPTFPRTSATILLDPNSITELPSAPDPGRTHLVVWDAEADLGAISYRGDVQIFIRAVDGNPATLGRLTSPEAASNTFFMFQNFPPTVEFNDDPLPAGPLPGGAWHGHIPIDIALTDEEGDNCTVTLDYSLDAGATWFAATLATNSAALTSSPAGEIHTLVWDSATDLAWFLGTVTLRVRAFDTEPSAPSDTQTVALNNRAIVDLFFSDPVGDEIFGPTPNANIGFSVRGVGDVNGDGIADFVVGHPNAGANGQAFLIFGRERHDWGDIDLAGFDSTIGIMLHGTFAGGRFGATVCGVGDVNGDGIDDFIIGADLAQPGASAQAGEAYLIFGRSNAGWDALGGSLNVGSLNGTHGVRFPGLAAGHRLGSSVAGAGDVNGDGLADLLIAAPFASSEKGFVYLVFGRSAAQWSATGGTFDLASPDGTSFVRLEGGNSGVRAGISVAGVNDATADGLDDFLIGADRAALETGEAYLVFGRSPAKWASTPIIDLSGLDGTDGVRFEGLAQQNRTGYSVAPAGDVNGDGRADFLIGAPGANPQHFGGPNRTNAGITFLVFGQPAATWELTSGTFPLVNLSTTSGIAMYGTTPNDESGTSVAGIGDFNGDGFADMLVGAPKSDVGGSESGAAYIIYGRGTPGWNATGGSFTLGTLDGTSGTRLHGPEAGGEAGKCVAAAGDIDGDGFADLLVGVPFVSVFNRANAGIVVLIRGTAFVETPTATVRVFDAPDATPFRAAGIVGDGSEAASPATRCWLSWDNGSGSGGPTSPSLTVVRLHRDTSTLTNLPDGRTFADVGDSMWEITTNRVLFSGVSLRLRFTQADVAHLDDTKLVVLRGPTVNGPWTLIDTVTIDATARTITFHTPQTGFFLLTE